MKLFIRQVAAYMVRMGYKVTPLPEYNAIEINDCRIHIRSVRHLRRSNERGTVSMLNRRFSQPYPLQTIAEAIIEQLPILKEEKQKEEVQRAKHREVSEIDQFLTGSGVRLSYYDNVYRVTVNITDKAAALACADMIQDSGFIAEESIGYRDGADPEYMRRQQMRRMWYLMSKEERTNFLEWAEEYQKEEQATTSN